MTEKHAADSQFGSSTARPKHGQCGAPSCILETPFALLGAGPETPAHSSFQKILAVSVGNVARDTCVRTVSALVGVEIQCAAYATSGSVDSTVDRVGHW